MIDPHVIYGILCAAIISLAGSVLLTWRALTSGWLAAIQAAMGMIACAVGWSVAFGWQMPPPADVKDWAPPLALAGAPVLLVMMINAVRATAVRLAIAAGVVSGAGIWLIYSHLPHLAVGAHAASLAVAIGILAACAAWGWEQVAPLVTPLPSRLVLIVVSLGMVAGLAVSVLVYGLTLAVLSSTIAAPLVVVWWRPQRRGAATTMAIVGAWMFAITYALADIDRPLGALLPCALLLVAAGLSPLIAVLPGLRTRPRLAGVASVLLALVLVGGATAWMVVVGVPPNHGPEVENDAL